MKLFSLLVVAVSLSGISCERHEFSGKDGTRQLQDHAAGHAGAATHEEKAQH